MSAPPPKLANLEAAEDLVIGILESAGNLTGELKEIQSSSEEKRINIHSNLQSYYDQLQKLKEILNAEIDSIQEHIDQSPPTTCSGIDKLAIAEWEAKIIADNLHELLPKPMQ